MSDVDMTDLQPTGVVEDTRALQLMRWGSQSNSKTSWSATRKQRVVEQKGRCGLCRTKLPARVDHGKRVGFVLDHHHKTGKIRSVLCYRCNGLVGYLETSGRELLVAAVNYVKHWEQDRDTDLLRYKEGPYTATVSVRPRRVSS